VQLARIAARLHTHRVEGRVEGEKEARTTEWRVAGEKKGEEEEKEEKEGHTEEGEAHGLNFDSTDFLGKNHAMQT
jgi:hypothetical protein